MTKIDALTSIAQAVLRWRGADAGIVARLTIEQTVAECSPLVGDTDPEQRLAVCAELARRLIVS
jgi:hypothetical protein